jgi:hypothetical protein
MFFLSFPSVGKGFHRERSFFLTCIEFHPLSKSTPLFPHFGYARTAGHSSASTVVITWYLDCAISYVKEGSAGMIRSSPRSGQNSKTWRESPSDDLSERAVSRASRGGELHIVGRCSNIMIGRCRYNEISVLEGIVRGDCTDYHSTDLVTTPRALSREVHSASQARP